MSARRGPTPSSPASPTGQHWQAARLAHADLARVPLLLDTLMHALEQAARTGCDCVRRAATERYDDRPVEEVFAAGDWRLVDRADDGRATTEFIQREIAAAVHTVESAVTLWNHAAGGMGVRRALELVAADREADNGDAR